MIERAITTDETDLPKDTKDEKKDHVEFVSASKSNGIPSETVFLVPSASRLQKVTVSLLGVGLLAALGVIGYLLMQLSQDDRETSRQLERFERQIQRLDAGISFDAQRQRLLLGMRDEIMRVNPSVGLHDAYQYAEYVLRASDKYPTIPPLLLVAIGTVESGFRADAVSGADARGLYQIWPSTGRMLARGLGWEYSEDLLSDPAKNTEMAALYLDILYTVYNDPSLVLAEYNGGPRNAGLFRAGASGVPKETRDYVPKVLKVFERLQQDLEVGTSPVRLSMSVYRDRNRRGKRLAMVDSTVAPGPSTKKASGSSLDDDD